MQINTINKAKGKTKIRDRIVAWRKSDNYKKLTLRNFK